MIDPTVASLLDKMEAQLLALQINLEKAQELAKELSPWSAEEEAQYRLRHQQ